MILVCGIFVFFLGETSNAEKVNNTQSTQAAIGSSTSIDTNKNNSINSDFSSDNTSGSNYTIASRPTLHTNNFIQTSTVLEGIFDQNGQNYYYLNGQKQTNYFLRRL